jgi:hypothetical protein
LRIDRHQTLAGQHVTGFDPLEADNVGHERFRGSTLLSSAHLDQVRGRVIKNCRFSTALGLASAGGVVEITPPFPGGLPRDA